MQLGQTRTTTPDYDFYGPPTGGAPAPVPAPRPGLGGGNQFGSPVAQAPTPVPLVPARSSVPLLKVARVVGPLVLAVVAGVFGLGRFGFINPADVTPPPTLGGLPASQDPVVQEVLADQLSASRAEFTGADVQGQVYGSFATGAYVLVSVDESVDVDETFDDLVEEERAYGGTPGAVVEVGDASCVVLAGGALTACVHSSWTRSSYLLVMTPTPTSTDAAAALLDEAWSS